MKLRGDFMGLFNRSKKIKASIDIQYRLHIICIVEDWNQMQQRDFVAADIEEQQFYRVHEIIGGWGESRYIVKPLDDAELKRLFDSAAKSYINTNIEQFCDRTSFAAELQNTEVVEITKEQILHTRKV